MPATLVDPVMSTVSDPVDNSVIWEMPPVVESVLSEKWIELTGVSLGAEDGVLSSKIDVAVGSDNAIVPAVVSVDRVETVSNSDPRLAGELSGEEPPVVVKSLIPKKPRPNNPPVGSVAGTGVPVSVVDSVPIELVISVPIELDIMLVSDPRIPAVDSVSKPRTVVGDSPPFAIVSLMLVIELAKSDRLDIALSSSCASVV